MPVRRFRSAEEMNKPRWREPGDPELARAIEAVWAFGRRAANRRFPPGVHRHRTIESLNALTEKWATANFEAFTRQAHEEAQSSKPRPGEEMDSSSGK